MRVVLEIVTGRDRGQKILLRHGQTLSIGRTQHAEWSAPQDPLMSSVHFAVSCQDSGCRLRDLGSTNGTFLNGQRIDDVALSEGDEILAGQTRFRVQLFETPRARTADMPAPERSPLTDRPAPAPLHRETPSAGSRPEAAGIVPASRPSIAPPEWYESGLSDDLAPIRRAALRAAAWTRQPWLLQYCRNAARQADSVSADLLMVLAMLAEPVDVKLLLDFAQNETLGDTRFCLLGTLGNPAGVPLLLDGIGSDDPDVSVPAGAAFVKITGADIDSDIMAAETPPSDDSSAADEREPAVAPDLDLARDHWRRVESKFAAATRWCRGVDVSRPVPDDVLDQLDLESRWEVLLREHYRGTRRVSPAQVAPLVVRIEPPAD